jgi:mono/diheme cytochrome c family protein
MPRRPLLGLSVLATLFLAGCGSGTIVSPTPDTVIGTVAKGPTVTVKKGDPTAGKAVFASAGCGTCHTLKAAGSSGIIGPNLDQKKPSLEKAVTRVTEGKPPMPSFKGQLTQKQIDDVATFVVDSTGGG